MNFSSSKKNTPTNNSNVSKDTSTLTFTEIRNLYFDSVIGRELQKKYPEMISWRFSGSKPKQRDQSTVVLVMVNVGNKELPTSLNMEALLDCKASMCDVRNFVADKTDEVKTFITSIMLEVAHASIATTYFEKDVSHFSSTEIDKIVDVLTDEGIRVIESNHTLTVYIPRTN